MVWSNSMASQDAIKRRLLSNQVSENSFREFIGNREFLEFIVYDFKAFKIGNDGVVDAVGRRVGST